jgi:acetyltransferase-like isoleucine patch superfamily enzyme
MHRVGDFVHRPYLRGIYDHLLDPLVFGPLKYREWKAILDTPSVYFSKFPSELGKVSVGFGTRAGSVIDVSSANKKTSISIGKYVIIGKNVKILDTFAHDTRALSSGNFHMAFGKNTPDEEIKNLGPVIIGNCVGISEDVTIMGGSIIHDGSVIGTRSLVTGEVPPFTICGGVPAKLISPRFDKETTERLLKLPWWDLPPKVVWENRKLLSSSNIAEDLPKLEELVRKYIKSP